jgi:hypothetical protein
MLGKATNEGRGSNVRPPIVEPPQGLAADIRKALIESRAKLLSLARKIEIRK